MFQSEIPSVNVAQMRQVDDLAENEFHLALLQMMENAGRGLARLSRQRFLEGTVMEKRVVILAGPGGNGGGGLAAARRLHIWGAEVNVILGTGYDKLAPVPSHQYQALQSMGVQIAQAPADLPPSDLILDALLGYSAKGAPREPMAGLILQANAASAPILALDIPTGLNPETGRANEPAVRAAATMTLALPKTGLLKDEARTYVGELWLADISIPPALYGKMGIRVPVMFSQDDLVQLSS